MSLREVFWIKANLEKISRKGAKDTENAKKN